MTVITKNSKVFDKDISDQKSTYTYWLNQNQEKLYEISEDLEVNCESFKKQVVEMITNAHDTKAKRNFIATLNNKKYKNDAVLYVYNAMLCGSGLGVNV